MLPLFAIISNLFIIVEYMWLLLGATYFLIRKKFLATDLFTQVCKDKEIDKLNTLLPAAMFWEKKKTLENVFIHM